MRLVLLVTVCLFSWSAFALEGLDYASIKEVIEEKYISKFDKYPIVIVEKDELLWEMAQASKVAKTEEEDLQLKRDAIVSYMQYRGIEDFTFDNAIGIEGYMGPLLRSALAVHVNDSFTELNSKGCLVFVSSLNTNERTEKGRITGLSFLDEQEDYEHQYVDRLHHDMSLSDYQAYSLIHEVGHCMDSTYLPSLMTGNRDSDPHGVHRSEAFAEIFASLVLTQEGQFDLIKTRAYHRQAYSQFMGPYLLHKATVFDPMAKLGGVIYGFGSMLMKLLEPLYFDGYARQAFPLGQILNDSLMFTESHTYPGRSFNAVKEFYVRGEAAETEYRERAKDDPEFFFSAYVALREFKEMYSLISESVLSDEPMRRDLQDIEDLDVKPYCMAFELNQYSKATDWLVGQRQLLHSSELSDSDLKERTEALDLLQVDTKTYCRTGKPQVELKPTHALPVHHIMLTPRRLPSK
jgi:hypothetical protein